MSFSRLYRLSGIVLLIGAAASVILNLISSFGFPNSNNGYDPKVVTGTPWQLVNFLLLIAGVLVLLGIPAVYLRQARQTGILGLIGYICLAVAGMMFAVSIVLVDTLIIPWIATVAPKLAEGNGPTALFIFYIVSSVFLLLGTVLLGIATLRAHIFPRASAIVLIAAGVLNLISFAPLPPSLLANILGTLPVVLVNVALAWFGYVLMNERSQAISERQETATSSNVVTSI